MPEVAAKYYDRYPFLDRVSSDYWLFGFLTSDNTIILSRV